MSVSVVKRIDVHTYTINTGASRRLHFLAEREGLSVEVMMAKLIDQAFVDTFGGTNDQP